WVKLSRNHELFYITKHEISDGLFNNSRFIRKGRYLDPALRLKQKGPEFWNKDGSIPRYFSRKGGKEVAGDGFPIVGIVPEAAEAFGKFVFGAARLPTGEEWQIAARIRNQSGKYPWRDDNIGRRCCNYF